MSIIIRQTLKSSIYSYIGVIIGYISTVYLMPQLLSTAEIGNIRLIQNYGRIFGNLMLLGIPATSIRFFPFFQTSDGKHNGFLKLIYGVGFTGILIFVIVFSIGADTFFEQDIKNSANFAIYWPWVLPFTIATILFLLNDAYATAVKESTIGFFLRDFLLRFIFLILLVLLALELLQYSDLVSGMVLAQLGMAVLLGLFLFRKKLFKLNSKINFKNVVSPKEMATTSFFNWFTGVGGMVVITLDTFMINRFDAGGESSVGIYTTLFFFCSLMLIPQRSLQKIGGPVLAEAYHQKNLKKIESVYRKSAATQFLAGGFIYVNLLIATPFIFLTLPDKYLPGLWVIPVIGLANLIKLGTGIKSKILVVSDHYRWNTWLLLVFIIVLAILNYFFIKAYGITGAALASLLAVAIHQFAGVMVIRSKMDILPFSPELLKALILFILIGTPAVWISTELNNAWWALVICAVFSLAVLISGYKLTLSEEINSLVKKLPFIKS